MTAQPVREHRRNAADPGPEAVRRLGRRLQNGLIRTLVRAGLGGSTYALLETTGRRSGLPRQVPVGNGVDGDRFWITAEGGRRSDYVRNLLADPQVRIRIGRRWRTGVAQVLPHDDARARHRRWVDRGPPWRRLDGKAWDAHATDPVTVCVDLDD